MHVIIAFSYAKADVDIRDYGKKVHNLEIEFDETNDKLNKVFKCDSTCFSSILNVEARVSVFTML